jgi:hypothetical protein
LQIGVETKLTGEGGLAIFPNPFTEKTFIEFDNPGYNDYTLTVTDVAGRQVIRMKHVSSGFVEVDCHSLARGLYYIEIRGENIYRGKIIKE